MAKAKSKSTKIQTKPTTIVTFLLDRTGSMGAWKAATIEGFNGYLDSLKEETGADIRFTFLQFDSVSVDYVCVDVPVKDVAPLTNENYQPRASTPLIDAAVKTIRAVEEVLAKRADKPKVVVCFQTDGEENASREFKWEDLNGLVTIKTAEGWEFNFMGAGIDAYQQATKMGIGASHTMSYDSGDLGMTKSAFATRGTSTAMYASGSLSNMSIGGVEKMAAGDKFDPTAKTGIKSTVNHIFDLTAPPVTLTVKKKSSADFSL